MLQQRMSRVEVRLHQTEQRSKLFVGIEQISIRLIQAAAAIVRPFTLACVLQEVKQR